MMLHLESIKDNRRVKDIFELPKYYNVCHVCFYRDYPDFYKKLYNLLEPSVFHVKYRARFFHLANLFLSSR